MATRFIDKEYGANRTTAIANDTTGTRKVRNLPNAAGFVYDLVDNTIKYNKNGTIAVLADSSSGLTGITGQNLTINTADLSKTIRLNSQTDSVTASGDLIGFQSKPRTGVAGSQTVYGSQISAQISNGIALSGSGSIVGGHFDVYLRGTSAGTIAGDVRGLQIELTTDDAGTRDITGYVTGLRIRKAFSAGTVSGTQSAIRIEFPEVQTNSETYDALFDLTGTVGTGTSAVWMSSAVTSATAAGVLGIMVNGNKRYINLFSGTPA